MSDENKIRDAADAVKGIAEAVPIYQDAVQPAAKEIGTALQTVAKTIHIALAPVSALVWGFDQIKDFVSTKVAEKLKDVPPENIATPKPNVAGPALEALKYTGTRKRFVTCTRTCSPLRWILEQRPVRIQPLSRSSGNSHLTKPAFSVFSCDIDHFRS